MRICMIGYDMQEFGGLEEYAVNLAIGLKQQGHPVSYVSCAWVAPDNQYARRLEANAIPLVQPFKWCSQLASDWNAKESVLRGVMIILFPVTLGLGGAAALLRRRPLMESWTSAYNFLKGKIMDGVLGRDYRRALGRVLLSVWHWRWRADIYHIQGYTTALLFAIGWAHRRRIPVVYEEHQTPDPQFNWWKGFEERINLADRVIAVSGKSAEGLREVCLVTRPIVVRGPLLPDPFASGWREDAERPADAPCVVTTVARLYVTKGLTYLLDAAAAVKKTHPNAAFRIYGDGELRDELLAKAKTLGLDGEAMFVGAFATREDLSRIMAETDIFVMPSILEGQPLSVVEAMAYGRPIVTTAVGGVPELIQDGVNGLLCPPGDPESLAEKITSMLDDSALRARLGSAARASYEKSPFQPQAVSGHLLSVYRDVLAEQTRS